MRIKSLNTSYVVILSILSFFVFIFTVNTVSADDPGVIDTSTSATNQAKVCHNVACDDFGIINFELELEPSIVINSQSGITGNVWGDELGWINFSPTGAGVTINPDTGVLSGYAWSQVSGWINFSPTGEGVTINPNTGEFDGYAWSGGAYGGWIKFDCSDDSTCVRTTWRSEDSGCGGSCGETVDLCSNLKGKQTEIPEGYTELNGECVIIIVDSFDVCVNIDGFQTEVPFGMHTEGNRQCVNDIVDFCPNIDGVQAYLPNGMYIDINGNCVNIHSGGCAGPDCITDPGCTGPGCIPDPGCIGPDCITDPGCTGPGCTINNNGGGGNGEEGGGSGGDFIIGVINNIRTDIVKLIDEILPVRDGLQVASVSKFFATLGLVSGFVSLLGFADIGLNLLRLWSLFLYGMGFKKRNRPWGVVYDSVTKQPLDPAYVTLNDMNGNELGSSITDLDGRYGFLVEPGNYKILASKTNYKFPSIKLAGRLNDELYNDLYFGDMISITEQGQVIAKNIPLDALSFDWNEFAKKEQQRMKFYRRRDIFLAKFSDFMFMFGFAMSVVALIILPGPYNVIVFGLYLLLFGIRRTTVKRNRKGSVIYANSGVPLSYGILRVKSMITGQEIAHRVLDKIGSYYCLVPNGFYNVTIEKKNDDSSYSIISNLSNIEVKNGILRKVFKI